MKLWKRNAVVSVIVLFVAVALYLSWAYGRAPDEEPVDVFEPTLGDDIQSGLQGEDLTNASAGDKEPAEPVDSYFDQARLSRLEARDSALAILTDAVNMGEVSQEVRDNASVEIAKLADNAMTEAVIENMLRAKGFDECVVFISAEGVKVIVAEPDGGMTSAEAAVITDVILSESSVSVDNITIVHVAV